MSNKIEKQVRYLISEIRADEQGTVSGTAILFNTLSQDLGGFKEMICITPEEMQKTLDESDIVMLYNHDTNSSYTVLARSKKGKGSLQYTVDNTGVHFKFKVKAKDSGILESINAGDLDGCSFGFLLNMNDETSYKLEKQPDGSYIQYIYKFYSITDFSIVVYPAYTETSVAASTRALIDELQKQELEALKKIEDNKDQEKQEAFNRYYNKLLKTYLN